MIRLMTSLAFFSPRLLAVLVLGLIPAGLRAETVMFRNEWHKPVIVQTTTLRKGVLHRDQPCLLRYGECTPELVLTADKVVDVYDGKTNCVLFHDVLKAGKSPRYFSIVCNPRRSHQVQVICRRAASFAPPTGKQPITSARTGPTG